MRGSFRRHRFALTKKLRRGNRERNFSDTFACFTLAPIGGEESGNSEDVAPIIRIHMIPGVVVSPLKQIPDERGMVMHMLKRTDAPFAGFGEIYFSIVNPGAVKAWKKHLQMTL